MTKKLTPEDMALWKANTKDVKRLRRDKIPDIPRGRTEEDALRRPQVRPALPPPSLKASLLPDFGRKEWRNFVIEARLDMHGLTLESGYRVLENFLRNAQDRNIRNVIVVTGKGSLSSENTLRAHVPRWLKETSLRHLVTALHHPARPQDGGIGAYYVRIQKRK